MAWISVWQEVDGPKLRRLAKLLNTSKAEALGILCFLWFWGMNNADESGRIMDADQLDIEDEIRAATTLNPQEVVEALFASGWLDDVDGILYLHDWDTWQEQWYKLQRDRKNNAERMRRKRLEEKLKPEDTPAHESEKPRVEQSTAQEEKPKKKQAPKPEKKKYAEFVSMTEAEYEKLSERFGEKFTKVCIDTLDNYKGSKNKRYDSDYRAILSWVVDRVSERNPGLLRTSKESTRKEPAGNPFAEWVSNDA